MASSSFYLAVATVVVVCCCIPLNRGATECPPGYLSLASSCFRFESSQVTWEEARQQCENVGAHLAILDTVDKRDIILNYVKNNGGGRYWLDGREPWLDGRWIWYSKKTPVDQNLWGKGEPNDWSVQEALNGGWGSWSSWSTCSVTCGSQGLRSRTRVCDNPAPVGTGKPCPGADRQTEFCFPGQCPVNGGWTTWEGWQSCSQTCGSGTKLRSRTCTNPAPAYNGKNCSGNSSETIPCNLKDCPKCDTSVLREPGNGSKNCKSSVTSAGKLCQMRCHQGYEYIGSENTFYCNHNTNWNWAVRQNGKYLPSANVLDCRKKMCPDGFKAASDNWCLFTSDPLAGTLNYSDSVRYCSAMNPDARLVTIKTKSEYQQIAKLLIKDAQYWIGLDDRRDEGHFVFSDGTFLGTDSFTEWAIGSPSDSTLSNCVFMDGTGAAFMWRDTPCKEKKAFVCEIRRQDVSPPIIG
ncbi:uncharacterized protein LOC106173605 [Lingula anatina]|uniref:Uncharacterized protein LOC106173605 n=1 Tax=Lingula anatina TaxID=7574 RepID=A0A1S3JJZ4_LINAN|nr:uncharacterized protein LOC106173605 [Lingula anatina]|eukprot:XP_013410229.1 uncharacterized protein LOC106173605 [Lingula anatina]